MAMRKSKETEFYESAQGRDVMMEELQCAFVDDRDSNNMRWIVILEKHVVVIPLFKHDLKWQAECPFAYCWDVKDVLPEDLVSNDGKLRIGKMSKWHYSYSVSRLFIFEKMSASAKYTIRLREVALNSLRLDLE